ncbi:MAG: hypothetical protein JSU82_05570 [Rhodospirillales bacterium]|nr:MAG: hypothetical protein JSU82_05570 [Rhodospirillales bacterium]
MRHVKLLAGAAVVIAMAWPAFAQEDAAPRGPWEKWSISGGMFIADLDNTIRLGASGVGIEVDLEEALGLKSGQTVVRFDGAYRFGIEERHRVDFTWFDLSRDATRTLQADITLPDGTVLPIGTTVASEFNLAFYNVRYGYSFLKDDRIDFAGSLGLHITDVGLFLTDTSGVLGAGGDGVTAPLPVIGGRLDVALTPKWYVRSSLEAFYLEFDSFTGSLVDILVSAEYRAWENFALGIGVNSVHLTVENDNSLGLEFDGRVKSDFSGLMFYGKAMF